ncbi:MAG TPA: alpha/beta hydrolase, partial [Chloroflexia bacterium]|nr:alpha/beta hydrolase [Chloroflexia bacterium]
MPGPLFVLIHSPLVGPFTWVPLAAELERRGASAVVPSLQAATRGGPPYWAGHVAAVQAAAAGAVGRPLVLVGHSGAGWLLPAAGQALAGRVAAYVFVDADLPRDGHSRLESFPSPEAIAAFRRAATGGLLPT